jgi:Putative phage tail protein
VRVGSTVQGHEICDPILVGATVSQTILQRALYVRANFTFKLSWEYCLLDPMDIVTISDANLGLSNYPVRLLAIEEDDRGLLTFIAEELTLGVSTAAVYPTTAPFGTSPNQGVAAAPVNTPLIYEPPPALTGGAAQLWIGASGGVGGTADPNWGGAFVWASLDNLAYTQIATLTQRARQGLLSANVAPASGFDTMHALAINMAESNGALKGASDSAAQSGVTLALVDNELLAYAVATLSGVNAYSLTRLQRGMYGTVAAAHAVGAQFARLDAAVAHYNLPTNYIGQTLYLKFQSFNVFGAGIESLAACVAYSYLPTGAGSPDPIAAQLASGLPLDLGLASTPASVFDDFSSLTTAATRRRRSWKPYLMSEQLRLRGDIASNVAAYTGPSRETIVDTINNRLVVQDGVTPGGWPAARLAEVNRVARTAISASYSALSSDRLIAVTAIVSPIYVTLPAAATFQAGARLLVIDESGAASFSRTIVIIPSGTDVIVGALSNIIGAAYGFVELESNGAGQWTISDAVASGSTASIASNNAANIAALDDDQRSGRHRRLAARLFRYHLGAAPQGGNASRRRCHKPACVEFGHHGDRQYRWIRAR